ncbi:hypothetical protein LOTGIDRAFT_163564 [Lottia gigantea]|uniref:Uncharacterized protein n=1 Tax=Lottia gigantea TaxID=225164 RepID=V4ACK6_LOTGI|nr:hypothetical protein LOTGIDRAFT_163564 [Lottia gigantea]ESO91046.1 hypothetical protein LOTGIDRAFT_163564 [Lottia gigantea]
MILQILAVSCLAFFANAQIDVNSCTDYNTTVDKCNTDNTIDGGNPLTWASVGMFYSLPGNVYCSAANKGNFMKATECIQKAYIACGKNDFHKFVSSVDGIKGGVEYYCNNYEDFDMNCISELQMCAKNKAPADQTMPTMDDEFNKNRDYYCGHAEHLGECINSNDKLKNCAKNKTMEIIMKIAEELFPPACDATSFVISSVLLLVSLFITL